MIKKNFKCFTTSLYEGYNINKKQVLFALLILFIFPTAHLAQNHLEVDSLLRVLPEKSGINRGRVLNQLAFNLSSQFPDSAKNFAMEGMEIAKSAEDERLIAELWHTIAIIERYSGAYETAIAYEDSVLAVAKNWPEILGGSYQNRGVASRNLGKPQEALNDFQQSLKIYTELGDLKNQSQALNSIGVLYMYRDDRDAALEYFNQALEISKNLSDQGEYADVLNNIAIIYSRSGRFDSAMVFFQKSLQVEKERGNVRGESEGYTNIGSLQYLMGNMGAAVENFEKSQKIDSASQNLAGQMINLNNIAQVLTETGKPDKAVRYLHRALRTGQQIKALYELETTYLNFSGAFQALNRYDSALYYFTQYSAVHDSLLNELNIDKIAKLETQYRTREKEQALQIQKLRINEQESALARRDTLIVGLLLVILLTIGTAYLLYQRYRHRKELELQQSVIREQKRGLEAVFVAQEEERQRISKDLHDGIGQQLSALKLSFNRLVDQIQNGEGTPDELLRRIQKILDDTASDVRNLSHQMMPRALTEMGLEAALSDMLQNTFQHGKIGYTFDTYGLTGRLSASIEVSLYRICQELINNIIKHSGATHVSVQLLQNKGYAILIVEDNGSGMGGKKSADGIGLLNIRNRINTLNGEINYEPSPTSGLVTTVRIPLNRGELSAERI